MTISLKADAGGSSGTIQINGVDKVTVDGTGVSAGISQGSALITSGTPVSASGTSVDFTDIPSWVKRITVMFSGLSTNGTSAKLIQIGDSGGIESTGYIGIGSTNSTAAVTSITNYTTGFGINNSSVAAQTDQGVATLTLTDAATNLWAFTSMAGRDNAVMMFGAGSKALSGTLDRVRITTVNGTDTFDAGTINIIYE